MEIIYTKATNLAREPPRRLPKDRFLNARVTCVKKAPSTGLSPALANSLDHSSICPSLLVLLPSLYSITLA